MTIWTKSFWISTAERVIATFLMTLLAYTGLDAGGAVGGDGLNSIDWSTALATAGVAAGLSLVKCVLANIGTKDGPSLTHSEQVQPDLPNRPES